MKLEKGRERDREKADLALSDHGQQSILDVISMGVEVHVTQHHDTRQCQGSGVSLPSVQYQAAQDISKR
jgi:hypothetical protein